MWRKTENWLVVSTPLKNISQLGWLFPIYGKIKMFQTTNQNHHPEIFLPSSPMMSCRGRGTSRGEAHVREAAVAQHLAKNREGKAESGNSCDQHLPNFWNIMMKRSHRKHMNSYFQKNQTKTSTKLGIRLWNPWLFNPHFRQGAKPDSSAGSYLVCQAVPV